MRQGETTKNSTNLGWKFNYPSNQNYGYATFSL